MLQQRTCRRSLIYRFNRGGERGLGKTQSSAGGCKLLDGDISSMLGASVLGFVDFHKISSSQTVNTIWAGQVFIACFVPGGSSCNRDPSGARAAGAGTHRSCLTWSSAVASTPPTGHQQPAGSCSGTSPAQCCPPLHRPHLLPAVLPPPRRHPLCRGSGADVKSRGCRRGGWGRGGAPALSCGDVLHVVGQALSGGKGRESTVMTRCLPPCCPAPPTPHPLSPFLAQTLCV